MKLGDAAVSIRIAEAGSYRVSVHYYTIEGAALCQSKHNLVYKDIEKSADPLSDLARLLSLIASDLPR